MSKIKRQKIKIKVEIISSDGHKHNSEWIQGIIPYDTEQSASSLDRDKIPSQWGFFFKNKIKSIPNHGFGFYYYNYYIGDFDKGTRNSRKRSPEFIFYIAGTNDTGSDLVSTSPCLFLSFFLSFFLSLRGSFVC